MSESNEGFEFGDSMGNPIEGRADIAPGGLKGTESLNFFKGPLKNAAATLVEISGIKKILESRRGK